MVKIEQIEVDGWEAAIRGCRNPLNSWDKSDSYYHCFTDELEDYDDDDLNLMQKLVIWALHKEEFIVGPNDLNLMQKLVIAGTDHSKFMRMITVTMDITAPLYFNKELDTYKVGTVRNSCSTMHRIAHKPFELSDFSVEHLHKKSINNLNETISILNDWRDIYLNGGMVDNYDGTSKIYSVKDKDAWWQMIQLLPSSYNQKFTWQANYQVLRNIYFARRNHKLDEWKEFCCMIEKLPYGKELICYK